MEPEVDVVPVGALSEAVARAGVVTQTVGVYPDTREAELPPEDLGVHIPGRTSG